MKSSGVLRSQSFYILFGSLISIFAGLIFDIILPFWGSFELYWLGPFLTILMVILISYGIARYRLMDIRLIVKRSTIFTFLVLIITSVYSFFIYAFTQIFGEILGTRSQVIIGLLTSILIVIGFQPLKLLIQKATSKFLFKDEYDPQEVVRELSNALASSLELQHLFDSVDVLIQKVFHPRKSSISLMDKKTKFYVNATRPFGIGGPVADTGFTGRKILVDTYGGFARHGGGSFSGKDPTKVDRSAAYMARYIAKNIVAAGLAERIELQVSYVIGVARPLSISIETFGTGKVTQEVLLNLISKHFDLRPAAIIEYLGLRRPIYQPIAAYGHFGREDLNLPWEKTDKAEILRKEALGK